MIELPFFWGEFWSWPRSQKGLETTELRSIPHPRSLYMSPRAVFLSSSELGTASHPRPVFSGTSFPSHNFTEPVLRHIHDQLCHAAPLHATQGNLGAEPRWWGQAPNPTQFGSRLTKQRSRGRSKGKHTRKDKCDHSGLSATPEWAVLKCLGKDTSPHPHSCQFRIRSPSICWSTYLSPVITKAVWGGILSSAEFSETPCTPPTRAV